MSAKKKEFPRDLRGLCGGVVREPDGSELVLLFPVKAYLNLMEYTTELEQWLEDFDGSNEDKESLSKLLEREKAYLPELKKRILDHFKAQPGDAGKSRASAGVDHGAKSKVEKALVDIEAGVFDPGKRSKTMKAVLQALAFNQRHEHMPSHQELKDLGYNDQQATDAGKWLAMQNNPLFPPLFPSKPGRPTNKK
jgi:hypothetical protein